jgi:hypothetical protein
MNWRLVEPKISAEMKKISTKGAFLGLGLLIGLLAAGCRTGLVNSTPFPEVHFVPPTLDPGQADPAPLSTLPPTRQANCLNQLKFRDDLTVPDGTQVRPGQKITKRWLISNQGSCNWDQSYSLQLISGLALGAETRQGLYPVRQNSEAVLEIVFSAPDNPGRYNTWWQAYDPYGNRFGDPVYMEISVVEEE